MSGELDLSTASLLRDLLAREIPFESSPRVHLDASGLTFLGSTGIGLLVSACKRIRASGGSFSMSTGDGLAFRVLTIEGLIDYLGVDGHVSEDEP